MDHPECVFRDSGGGVEMESTCLWPALLGPSSSAEPPEPTAHKPLHSVTRSMCSNALLKNVDRRSILFRRCLQCSSDLNNKWATMDVTWLIQQGGWYNPDNMQYSGDLGHVNRYTVLHTSVVSIQVTNNTLIPFPDKNYTLRSVGIRKLTFLGQFHCLSPEANVSLCSSAR